MRTLLYLSFFIICLSCTQNSTTEKHISSMDNIVDVKHNVKEISTGEIMINRYPRIYLMDNYLIIQDYKAYDNLIYIFDKNTFKFLASTGQKGEGPSEIANMGDIGIDEVRRKFYVTDNGKQKIFSFDLDSVLADPTYIPYVKMNIDIERFPSDYQYINDTLCIGRIIQPIGTNDFKPSIGKWNMVTGDIQIMKYEHPEIEKKRIVCDASMEHNIYVEAYNYHDLITICDLDGNLKYNLYGPRWDNRKTNKIEYYRSIVFCGDKIFACYSGQDNFLKDKSGNLLPTPCTQIRVFDLNANYLYTLDIGYNIINLRYDKGNERIIMSMEDEIQFAYLNLE